VAASVVIVDSGSGNLRSVERALVASGGHPVMSSDPEVVRKADRLVVPGQGAFGDCISNLKSRELEPAIRESIARGTPYFGICLGMQILFDKSEEHGEHEGLGLLPGEVVRFEASVGKVPHMGWNSVEKLIDDPLLRGIPDQTYFYFTHSYYVKTPASELVALQCQYGHPVVAAVRKDNLFACQFHPEKSQAAGLKLLQNFLEL
jgi:glutamine amidotransferase